jgi:hypothetical protein
MKRILVSSALTLSVFFLLASASAKAQEFFVSAYARPAEMVDGIDVGRRVDGADISVPATAAASQTVTRELRAGVVTAH